MTKEAESLTTSMQSEQLRDLIKKWRDLAIQNDTKGEAAFYVAIAQRACASELEALGTEVVREALAVLLRDGWIRSSRKCPCGGRSTTCEDCCGCGYVLEEAKEG
jgi:ribosomal protein L9